NYYHKNPKNVKIFLILTITLEWVERAEDEFSVAKMIWQGKNPIYRIICFYAQQCVEKYLKAWIQNSNVPFTRKHNLKELLDLIVPFIPSWSTWESDLSNLSRHVVDTHFPSDSATANDAMHAMQTCKMVRQAVREQLKLLFEENENNP
ncbi:MAG: HEPN domain-containing protein, partial [Candidatus Poribacteria bacterium]|nr:HEPN domain-containing protein [Candidatus Poribacteria bacterium]